MPLSAVSRAARTGEGFGRAVSILQGNVDDLGVPFPQVESGARKPPAPDIRGKGTAHDIGKDPPELVNVAADDPRHIGQVEVLGQVLLHIVDHRRHPSEKVHRIVIHYRGGGRAVPCSFRAILQAPPLVSLPHAGYNTTDIFGARSALTLCFGFLLVSFQSL